VICYQLKYLTSRVFSSTVTLLRSVKQEIRLQKNGKLKADVHLGDAHRGDGAGLQLPAIVACRYLVGTVLYPRKVQTFAIPRARIEPCSVVAGVMHLFLGYLRRFSLIQLAYDANPEPRARRMQIKRLVPEQSVVGLFENVHTRCIG